MDVIMIELLEPGAHADPRSGASLLELASMLAGEPWSTRPRSVHRALAAVADPVNDLLSGDRRHLLAPLAPCLLGTNTADPRVWPAVVNACGLAAIDSVSDQELPGLLASVDVAREWFARASLPGGGPRRGRWAGRRDRRSAIRVIRSALRSVAGPGNPRDEDVDAVLCQALVDSINECRLLAGEQAIDPRSPLADCPRHIAVRPRLIRPHGCDWMELGYEPVPELLPDCLARRPRHAAPAPRAPGIL
jgi:hypothetical protein